MEMGEVHFVFCGKLALWEDKVQPDAGLGASKERGGGGRFSHVDQRECRVSLLYFFKSLPRRNDRVVCVCVLLFLLMQLLCS